tara:strand:- start:58 stop:801 length:744 start_codon:yes stop_codon:yes gene_type:complete
MRDVIAVWFSCGAASAVAAKLTIKKYSNTHTIRILNNPVVEEHEDNLRFLKDVQDWIDHPIESVINSKFPDASAEKVWDKVKFMSGIGGAPCTLHLKKRARQEWENNNKVDWHVLGFTFEEKKRHDRFVLTERENVIPVLIEAKFTKQNCYDYLKQNGIEPPKIYKLGYPNANCIGCVKASSPTYWNHVRKVHPDIFNKRVEQSRKIGCKLAIVKGKRIYLDELSEDAKGRPMRNLDFECGLFCEEI